MSGNYLLLLPVLLPIIIGVLILLIFREGQEKSLRWLVSLTTILNFALQFISFGGGDSLILARLTNLLELSLRADGLAKYFTVLVGFIWIVVSIYSFEYMRHEPKQKRFYGFLMITLGAMQGIGLANNLVTFYFFYEMMTFVTYPLVIHAMTPEAKKAGLRYLGYSIFGAALTLSMIIIVFNYTSIFDFNLGAGILNSSALQNRNLLLIAYGVAIIGFGAKAGMYPLHAWLPEAHPVAPAPASALLSGVITKAGILGIIRTTYYVFGVDFLKGSWVQMILIILALITIFLGSMLAYQSVELKVRLAYSSVSQVSYIIFGLLLMNRLSFLGALLHIYFHAFIKNTLFMIVGTMMLKRSTRFVEEIDGIGKFMPVTSWAFTIVSLALVGIPPLSGFISKYYLGVGALSFSPISLGYVGIIILILSSLLTFGYLITLSIKAFFPGRQFDYTLVKNDEPSLLTISPILLLTLGTILLGLMPHYLINYLTPIISMIS